MCILYIIYIIIYIECKCIVNICIYILFDKTDILFVLTWSTVGITYWSLKWRTAGHNFTHKSTRTAPRDWWDMMRPLGLTSGNGWHLWSNQSCLEKNLRRFAKSTLRWCLFIFKIGTNATLGPARCDFAVPKRRRTSGVSVSRLASFLENSND